MPDLKADDEGGSAKGADASGDKGADEDKAALTRAEFDELTKTVGTLSKAMQTVVSGMEDLKNLAMSSDDEGDDKKDVKKGKAKPRIGDSDLERLPRSKFFEMIKDEISEAVEGVKGSLNDHKLNTFKERLERQVVAAAEKHKDFLEWTDEIRALAKIHPSLDPEELYIQARGRDPEKGRELDEKYKKIDDDKKIKGESYGGTPPGSGKGKRNTNMSREEAAQSAWEEVMRNASDTVIKQLTTVT